MTAPGAAPDHPHPEIWISVFSRATSNRDRRLEEEERLLLAKLHRMAGGSSPVSGPGGVRRLVPDLCDLEEAPPSVTPQLDHLEETPLSRPEEANGPGQTRDQ